MSLGIVKVDVVPINENFRGLSYGEWAVIWDNWLMSEDPDTTIRMDILFLRGNLDYMSVTSNNDFPRFSDSRAVLNKTGQNAETIFQNTAILIPVLTAQYSVGDIYDGRKLNNEYELRDAVNRDSDESLRIWATVASNGRKSRIVHDLNEYRIESPLFRLLIPVNSKLRLGTQDAVKPGLYDTVVGGFFLIIRCLPQGSYRLEFGGNGRGNYSTNSAYDIHVKGLRNCNVVDSTTRVIRANNRKY
jgi:hypothetical protein